MYISKNKIKTETCKGLSPTWQEHPIKMRIEHVGHTDTCPKDYDGHSYMGIPITWLSVVQSTFQEFAHKCSPASRVTEVLRSCNTNLASILSMPTLHSPSLHSLFMAWSLLGKRMLLVLAERGVVTMRCSIKMYSRGRPAKLGQTSLQDGIWASLLFQNPTR